MNVPTSQKQRILLFSNTAWSLYKFRKKLIIELINQGYDVTLLACTDEYTERLTDLGASFIGLKNLRQKGNNPFHDYLLYKEIMAVFKSINPLLIFLYTIKPNIYGNMAAKKLGIKCISVVTGLGYTFLNSNLTSTIAKLLYKRFLNLAEEIWFLNREDKDLFISQKLISSHKAFLLPGEGIDCEEFSPGKIPGTSSENTISFVLIARLLKDKGVLEYIEAARLIKSKRSSVQFNIIGFFNVENPSAIGKADLDKWVEEGIVNYLGAVDDVRPEILKSDCIVLPSYREGMSMILMEAAALERPIITTQIPGCSEIVEDGKTGFLCKVRDAFDLAKKMEEFLNLSTQQRRVMGTLARQKMLSEFDVNKIIGIYTQKINLVTK